MTDTAKRPMCEAKNRGAEYAATRRKCKYQAEIHFDGKVLCLRHARIACLDRALEVGLVKRMEFK